MKFSYTARSADGALVSGTLDAHTRADAIEALRNKNTTPVSLVEARSFSLGKSAIFVSKRVKLSEKILFAKNLSGMLSAGLSISRALQVLLKQTTNHYLQTVITDILQSIDQGKTFSEGLQKYPSVFSNLFVSMVRAGEESGTLPQVLLEVKSILEKAYALNRKIKSALMYPMIIFIAIILIGILMFIFVVPTLTKTFKELGVALPATTRFIIFISDTISTHYILLAGILGVIAVGGYFAFRLSAVRRASDWLILRLPVIGGIAKEVNTARTTRTMASLLASGVTISRSLSITRDVLQNHFYKQIIARAEAVVQSGAPLSSVFREESKLYPLMVGEMMAVGEETGNLGTMLSDIALFYEAEVDAKTKDLSTIIEPVLMIFIGAAVGFFAVSMLSPMYSILDTIK